MDALAIAKASADKMWSEDEASRALGMEIVSVAPGKATMTMTVTGNMVNGHKICHGGYIFLLADSTFAFACNTYNQITVAQQCAVTFIRPGKLGDKLRADAMEVSKSGRSGIYDITVTRQDGTVIAEFRGHSRAIEGEIVPGLTNASGDGNAR
ncbi:MAG: hydroxyphenylacetyl-CoA thioesterase PaaI [Xanthobacteraceae bacterium]|nr:hydroxyphenylacetyl-CoA thioesterase PaaI [Xanthobacteraceae bacterium]